MVIILFCMLMMAATDGLLMCPEMAVCVLSNIALYQRHALKTDRPFRGSSVHSHIVFVRRPLPTAPVIPLTSG